MDPKYLPEMRNLCEKKDFIFASRYQKPNGGSDDDDIVTVIGNYFFTFLGNLLFNLKITDILFLYTLGKTSSFRKLNLKSFDFRLCVEIPIKAKYLVLGLGSVAFIASLSANQSNISHITHLSGMIIGVLFLYFKFNWKNIRLIYYKFQLKKIKRESQNQNDEALQMKKFNPGK